MTFTFYSPTKIVFGQPADESLNAELDALNATHLLLVTDPILAQLEWAQRICLGPMEAGYVVSRFINVGSTPSISEVAAGLALAREQGVQAVIALGGGSVIDVAKAIAMLLTNSGSCTDYLHGSRSIEQPGCPLIIFRRDGRLQLGTQTENSVYLFLVLTCPVGNLSAVLSCPFVCLCQQRIERIGEHVIIVRASEYALLAEIGETHTADVAGLLGDLRGGALENKIL